MSDTTPDPVTALLLEMERVHAAGRRPGVRLGAAARHIGCSRQTVFRWCRSGRVPHAELRGRLRPTWRVPNEWVRAARLALDRGDEVPLLPAREGTEPTPPAAAKTSVGPSSLAAAARERLARR